MASRKILKTLHRQVCSSKSSQSCNGARPGLQPAAHRTDQDMAPGNGHPCAVKRRAAEPGKPLRSQKTGPSRGRTEAVELAPRAPFAVALGV